MTQKTLEELNKDFIPEKFLPTRANRKGDTQGLPTINDRPIVQDAVIADIEVRKQVGIARYGTGLQPFNGRNALQDLYEELLDAAMYVKQKLIEEKEEWPCPNCAADETKREV